MLPMIYLWSLFRDDAGQNLARYKSRINALDYPRDRIRIYAIEGDSTDETWKELIQWSQDDKRVIALKQETGLPRMSHTPQPIRLKTLARVGNQAIRRIVADVSVYPDQIPNSYGMLVESDLVYGPRLVLDLVERIPDQGVIAPMVWISDRTYYFFYDLWAFRTLDGKYFPQMRPSWFAAYFVRSAGQFGNGSRIRNWNDPFEIQSAGSCLLMPIQGLVDGIRYTDQDAVVGICKDYRERGYKIYVAPDVDIFHPHVENPYDVWKPNQSQKDLDQDE